MTPGERLLKDHWGHGYLNPDAPAMSGLGAGPPQPASGPFIGRATPAQHAESERIRALIYEHRRQTAAREAERAIAEEQT